MIGYDNRKRVEVGRGMTVVDERVGSDRRVGHAGPVHRPERRAGSPGPRRGAAGTGPDRGRSRHPRASGGGDRRPGPTDGRRDAAAGGRRGFGERDAGRLPGGGRGRRAVGPALAGAGGHGRDRPRLRRGPAGRRDGVALSDDRALPGLWPGPLLRRPGRAPVPRGFLGPRARADEGCWAFWNGSARPRPTGGRSFPSCWDWRPCGGPGRGDRRWSTPARSDRPGTRPPWSDRCSRASGLPISPTCSRS